MLIVAAHIYLPINDSWIRDTLILVLHDDYRPGDSKGSSTNSKRMYSIILK